MINMCSLPFHWCGMRPMYVSIDKLVCWNHMENENLKKRAADPNTDGPAKRGRQADTSASELLGKLERGAKAKLLDDWGADAIKKGQVSKKVKSLSLSPQKAREAQTLTDKIMEKIEGGVRLEQMAFKSKLESLLVEWGIPVRAVSKNPDYKAVAELLAAVVVSASE